MALEIFKLFGSIMVDSSAAEDSIQKTDEKAEKLGNKLQSGIKTAGKWAAGITAGAAAVGGAMFKAAEKTAAHADEIDKMSQKLGMSRKAYQEWDYVLSQAGVDIGSMATGMKTLTNKLDDAKNGSDKATAMFEKLGLSMEDLKTMSREDIFKATISGFQQMEDSTERAALANDLFGKSGQELTALFNESAESTQELIDKANELGLVMSDDAITAGVDMTDAMDTAKRSLQAVGNGIGAELMPMFVELLNWVTAHMPEIQAAIKKVTDFVVKAIEGAKPYIEELKPVFEGVFKGIEVVWENVLKPVLTGLITFLSGVFAGDWKKAWEGLSNIVSTIFKALIEVVKIPINGIIKLLNGAIDGFNKIQIPDWVPAIGGKGLNIPHIPMLAEGGDITKAGTVLVGERGPEFLNLPAGASVTPLDKATQIDYDQMEERFVAALTRVAPLMRSNIDIAPNSRGLFDIIRDEALAYESTTGEPAFLN